VMQMQVTVPEEFMGDIIGDLNGRRGRVLGVDSEGSLQIIKANVPLAEVQHYQPDLTSKTGGRGTFEMEFSHYEEVPPAQAEKVITQLKADKEKE
jgi:elongation factor G